MKFRIACIILFLAFAVPALAAESVVWQIGKSDNSYAEFAIAGDYNAYWAAFRGNKTFRIGTDDPAKSWPFIHPGTSDAWVRYREQPFTILFSLDSPPAGIFTLTVDFVDTHAGNGPVYQVNINGKSGRFNLPTGAGDASLTDASKGKEYVLTVPIPASLLTQGENKLVLNIPEGSWVLYDALRLTNDPEKTMPDPTIKQVTVSPTIRFVNRDSKLKQVLELTAELTPGATACEVSVTVNGLTQKVSIEPGLLGTAAQEILVDEISAPAKAEVTITSGSQSKTATCDLQPQRHWRLYLQPSSHVDIGYTDWQERVIQRHNDSMSLALDLCKQFPDFKWNTEAAWVEDNYLSMMPEDRKSEFINLAKQGRIGCQAIYGNMLTGICSHESFIRDLYYAHETAKKYGIPFDIAMSSDVPTQVWTLPTILAGSGIKYFSAGLNLTRGDSFNRLFAISPFYWQGPDGSKVLTWLSPGYAYAANLRLFDGIGPAQGRLEAFLKSFERVDYPYDAVLAFGGVGDNQPLSDGLAKTVDEWNKTYAYPRIILCRGPEFFEYMEAGFKDRIPTLAGDGGVYWEDGAGSSAHETTLVRKAKEDLASAEKLWSLLSASRGIEYPKADIALAWKNAILYDEHTWGAHCSISEPQNEQTLHQWKVKAQFAYDAAARTDSLVGKALDELAKSGIKAEGESVIVFNPLSFEFSGPVAVKDAKGALVEIWAKKVPALGCGVFPVQRLSANVKLPQPAEPKNLRGEPVDQSKSLPVTITAEGAPVLQNRFYRLEFDKSTGAVKSLYDKELKIELVDPKSRYGINEYIYVAGQGQTAKELSRDPGAPPATAHGKIEYIADGKGARPYRCVMEIISSAPKTPRIISRVILYEDMKRVDFENLLTKEETLDKEAGYFAFPFALKNPEFYVELPDGVVRPKKDMLAGGCMQWYCLQDFAAAADDRCAVVWTAVESPLITIGDLNRDTFRSPLPIENGSLFAYVFNNYWFTNYKASQGGDMMFRFSLTSMGKYDPAAASRFGQSVRTPVLARVCGPSSKPSASVPRALCSVSPSNVAIQAVKQAESGGGWIVRLRELSGKATDAELRLKPWKLKEAWSCNLVEDPQSKLTISVDRVKVKLPANGLATVLLR